jgi:hypothetical protein
VTPEQAGICIATLQAYFPRFPIPESTAEVWATELEPHRFDDVRTAIARLAATWPDEHYPGLQALLGKVREVTQQTMSPALTAGRVDPKAAAETQKRMAELLAEFWVGRVEDRMLAEVSLGLAEPADEQKYARQKAQRMLDATVVPDAELPVYHGGKVPSPCPIGQRAAARDGILVCPHCNEAIRDAEGRTVSA